MSPPLENDENEVFLSEKSFGYRQVRKALELDSEVD